MGQKAAGAPKQEVTDFNKIEGEGVLFWEEEMNGLQRRTFFEAMGRAGAWKRWADNNAPRTIPADMRPVFVLGVARAMVAEAVRQGNFGWI